MLFRNRLIIHCWGGYGSQLFALALALDIKKIKPAKNLVINFHNSGISERNLEIDHLLKGIEFVQVIDFKKSTNTNVKRRQSICLSYHIKLLLKKLLIATYILVELEDNQSLSKIMPWTKQIRGHYSHRRLSRETITEIANRMNFIYLLNGFDLNPILVLQYRIGDLAHTQNKTYIRIETLKEILIKLLKTENLQLLCLTDSIDIARLEFAKINLGKELSILSMPPQETIRNGLNSKIFVGTNSKISLWIAILRYCFEIGPVYLPMDMVTNLEYNLGILDSERIDSF